MTSQDDYNVNQSPIVPQPIQNSSNDYVDSPDVLIAPPNKSKKRLIIGLITIVVLLIFGCAVFAYSSWYSKPEKVMSDAIVNVVSSKSVMYNGNVAIVGDNLKLSFDIDGKQAGAAGALNSKLTITDAKRNYIINGSGLIDSSGNTYFKANVKTVVPNIISKMGFDSKEGASAAVDSFIEKVNNKWIKTTDHELSTTNNDYLSVKNCTSDLINKYKDNKAAISELTDLYKKQQFINSNKNLGQKDGSVGFLINVNSQKLASFKDGLEKTKIYKSLSECGNEYSVSNLSKLVNENFAMVDNPIVEVWIDSWTHQITKISANGYIYGAKVSADLSPRFNQTVEINAPSEFVSMSQLKLYTQDLSRVLFGTTELPNIDYTGYLDI